MREMFVDYNHIGRSTTFEAPLFADERKGLTVGEQVRILGDTVPDAKAVVLAINNENGRVKFRFI